MKAEMYFFKLNINANENSIILLRTKPSVFLDTFVAFCGVGGIEDIR